MMDGTFTPLYIHVFSIIKVNGVDPDQMALIEASRSGSTVFAQKCFEIYTRLTLFPCLYHRKIMKSYHREVHVIQTT